MNTQNQEPTPALASVEAACRYLGGICRASLYEMINAGDVQSVKIAGRRMITTESMNELIARAARIAPKGKLAAKIANSEVA